MEKQIQEISVEDIEIKIRESKVFRLRYFAKKHNDYIVRYGMVCDKMKFWESDESKKIEVNEIKKEKIKDSIQNEKENQTEKIREKVIQEVEVENKMLDTKDSVNAVIRKDISQEKAVVQLKVKENDLKEQAESKQDIIDNKSDEPDYFDLMLEKIGF